jgi:hypothetical protein
MPSICTAKTIRKYFQTGALPDHGKICPVYERPFGLPGNSTSLPLEFGDDILLEALRALASQI